MQVCRLAFPRHRPGPSPRIIASTGAEKLASIPAGQCGSWHNPKSPFQRKPVLASGIHGYRRCRIRHGPGSGGSRRRSGNSLDRFLQQYRLFFRYHAPSKVIVFAWVNDEGTKRVYESSDEAYRVFRKMLQSGHPPDDWKQLLAEARAEGPPMNHAAFSTKSTCTAS